AAEHCQPQAAGHSSHRGNATPGRAFGRPSPRPRACRRANKRAVELMGVAFSRAYDSAAMRSLPPLVASLARIPFFAGLDDDALNRLAAGPLTGRVRRGRA